MLMITMMLLLMMTWCSWTPTRVKQSFSLESFRSKSIFGRKIPQHFYTICSTRMWVERSFSAKRDLLLLNFHRTDSVVALDRTQQLHWSMWSEELWMKTIETQYLYSRFRRQLDWWEPLCAGKNRFQWSGDEFTDAPCAFSIAMRTIGMLLAQQPEMAATIMAENRMLRGCEWFLHDTLRWQTGNLSMTPRWVVSSDGRIQNTRTHTHTRTRARTGRRIAHIIVYRVFQFSRAHTFPFL